jgi:hypothetical protein
VRREGCATTQADSPAASKPSNFWYFPAAVPLLTRVELEEQTDTRADAVVGKVPHCNMSPLAAQLNITVAAHSSCLLCEPREEIELSV